MVEIDTKFSAIYFNFYSSSVEIKLNMNSHTHPEIIVNYSKPRTLFNDLFGVSRFGKLVSKIYCPTLSKIKLSNVSEKFCVPMSAD